MFCFQVLFNWRIVNYIQGINLKTDAITNQYHAHTVKSKHRYIIKRMCLFLTNSLCNLPFTISTHPNVQICIFPRWSNNKIHLIIHLHTWPHWKPQKHHDFGPFFPQWSEVHWANHYAHSLLTIKVPQDSYMLHGSPNHFPMGRCHPPYRASPTRDIEPGSSKITGWYGDYPMRIQGFSYMSGGWPWDFCTINRWTWKWMVGRRSFPFWEGHLFSCNSVSFRERTSPASVYYGSQKIWMVFQQGCCPGCHFKFHLWFLKTQWWNSSRLYFPRGQFQPINAPGPSFRSCETDPCGSPANLRKLRNCQRNGAGRLAEKGTKIQIYHSTYEHLRIYMYII